MKCTFCGTELPQDAAFCANCGNKLGSTAAAQEGTPEAAQPPQGAVPPQEGTQGAAQQQEGTQGAAQPQGAVSRKSKGNLLTTIILAILAIIVIAVLVVVVLLVKNTLFGSSGNQKQLVYLKDGEIFYVKNMDSDKDAVSVCDLRGETKSYNDMTLTEDGKYLYYIDDMDDYGNGDLYRAELKKLKSNASKNDKYIIEIASNVASYQVLSDGEKVVYEKSNGKLIYFDGKTEDDIVKDVYGWVIDQTEKNVIYTKQDTSGMEIICYNLKSGEDETLAEKVDAVVNSLYHLDFIVYRVNNSDGTYDLYYTDSSGDGDRIARGAVSVYGCNAEQKSVYYVVQRQEQASLYDFFVDDTATAEPVTEPSAADYLTLSTLEEAMTDWDSSYFSRYSENLQYFYENLIRSGILLYDSSLGLYYYYGDQALFYYNDQTSQWYMLDEIAFNAAYDAYWSAQDKNELIAELKEESITNNCFDLYYWEDGKEAVLVAENINYSSIKSSATLPLIFYQKSASAEGQGIPLSEVNSYWEAWEYYEDAEESVVTDGTIYYYNGSKENELDENGEIYQIEVSEDEKQVVLTIRESGENTAICYDWSKSVLANGKEISDEVTGGTWNGGAYYYFEDVIDSYGDLYQYKNGKSERILRDVYVGYVVIYEDGNFVAYDCGYDGDDDLSVYNSKMEAQVIRDVEEFTYIQADRIVYMKNDSLYVYNGKKEDSRIARNVDDYICHGESCEFVY